MLPTIIVVLIPFFGVAFFCHWLFYSFGKQYLNDLKIQSNFPQKQDFVREFCYSLSSSIVFIIVIYLMVFEPEISNKTLIYNKIEDFGVFYSFRSIIMIVIFHDAYFYWTHRLLHLPFFFRKVHKIHHQSHNPTPWTAFSFHPIEALINIAVFPILAFLIPIHKYILLAWWLWVVLGNILGHLGYDPLKKHLHRFPFNKFIMSSHHNLHHQKSIVYFGFYFNFWDKIMKTNSFEYQKNKTNSI